MTAPSAQVLAAAAGRLEQVAPGYLEQVRRAAARLAARPAGPGGDVRAALDDLAWAADIDVDVPTMSARRAPRMVKGAVKRLIGWYVRYLGQQVTVLGQSMTRLGGELVDRVEYLDARTEAMRRDVSALQERIERLEHQSR